MNTSLIKVPGITNQHETRWLVRVLQIKGRDLVLGSLADWERESPSDYKKIMKVIQRIGQVDRMRDEKHVKKSKNPKHDQIYEIRAHRGSARLMFFYSEKAQSAVICTNTYWKAKDSKQEQNQAFETCHKLKQIYEQNS